jgi:hypothetical protein
MDRYEKRAHELEENQRRRYNEATDVEALFRKASRTYGVEKES